MPREYLLPDRFERGSIEWARKLKIEKEDSRVPRRILCQHVLFERH
jgi:hypothetical protein